MTSIANPSIFEMRRVKLTTFTQMARFHLHDYYEIYYQVSGEKKYFIKNNIYRVTKGDMVFINTRELHRTTSTEFYDREIILLYFSKDMLAANDELLHFPSSPFLMGNPVLSLNMQQQQWAEQLLHSIWLEYQRQEPGYLACIQSMLTQLIVFSVRCNILRSQLAKPKEKSMHPKIADIVQWINRRFSEHLTLASLSSGFFISPSYLSRLFREMTGFSFVEYLAAVRIKEAQKLLRETGWKVSHISEQVGFESEKHFYKTFRKITGQSPLVYRKLERGAVMFPADDRVSPLNDSSAPAVSPPGITRN